MGTSKDILVNRIMTLEEELEEQLKDSFVIVTWPESQEFMDKKNCFLINDSKGYELFGPSAYFVRADIYKKHLLNKSYDNKED